MSEPCFICPRDAGERHIRRYEISVCLGCWDRNRDGWPRQSEPRILEHLKARGLPVPVRNVLGLLPREGRSRVSIIPTARPQAAAPLRERDLDVRLARVERERDAPVIAADRLSVAEAEWRERCFTERRVSCTAPTAATHDIMPSFVPLPYSPLR